VAVKDGVERQGKGKEKGGLSASGFSNDDLG
jgi:hypothetical protein